MSVLSSAFIAIAALALSAKADLSRIDHVVLFMQENRAFDHYFGTMAGVRGFKDPNRLKAPGHKPVWYQDVDSTLSNATSFLLPWYLNYLGGHWVDATQCMFAGSNGWNDNHAALNHDLNNKWALNNTPWSWGHYARADLPVHFGIAEGWTIGDMYQESVVSSTNPNRVSWASGSINVPGSPQDPTLGVYIGKYSLSILFAQASLTSSDCHSYRQQRNSWLRKAATELLPFKVENLRRILRRSRRIVASISGH